MKTETIILGGGCFWCTEAIFQKLKGVTSAIPGYAGGKVPSPSYTSVSSGDTGHAEVVKVDFDPQTISLKQILDVFFHTHNPTTPDRQDPDAGPQYRSIILYTNPDQLQITQKIINRLNISKEFPQPIVTQVKKLDQFYPAEDYHQDYYQNNSHLPYCQMVISPKLKKFQSRYSQLLK